MAITVDALQAVRTPPEVKAARGKEYDQHLTQTIRAPLEKVAAKDLANCGTSSSNDALDDLDPYLDTLPYLYIVHARVATAKRGAKTIPDILQPGGLLYHKLVSFLVSLDPVEVRYVGAKWKDLVDYMLNIAVTLPQHPQVLGDIASAMLKLDPSAGTFTSTHLAFVKACMETGSYGQAHLILEKEIHSFPSKTFSTTDGQYLCSNHHFSNGFIDKATGFTETVTLHHIQEYYMLGAMCYIGARRWSSAVYQLEHVLCTPANNSANGVMLEAYKKWILVNLMLKGELPSLPKGPNAQAMKLVHNTAKTYESLAEAFKIPNPAKLCAEVDLAKSLWIDDSNYGLVKRVVAHHRTLSIIRLGKMYAAMPLSKVAAHQGLSIQEVAQNLQSLIRDGVLNAVIDQPSNAGEEAILRFLSKSATGNGATSELDLREELVAQTNRIKSLAAHVEEADRRLAMTKEYIDHTRKARRSKEERNGTEEESIMDISMGNAASSDEGEESFLNDM